MYLAKLNIVETEKAIKQIKDNLETLLSENLNLLRVSAPLFLEARTGLNDNLDGIDKPVSFVISTNQQVEMNLSLAKWKRMALYKYEIEVGNGIYTDMNAIHPSKKLDATHSIYVDQWDWEINIAEEDRTLDTLKNTVRKIYKCFKEVERNINSSYPQLTKKLPDEIFFITSQELEDKYPKLSPKEREYKIAQIYGAVFLMQIGHHLQSGEVHDTRAPDYDDWTLNGDIILYYELLDIALRIVSMGIRVNKDVLEQQLILMNAENRKNLDFHKMILNQILPQSIGGGIGQSRLCLFLLEKRHIGEVQVSIWPDDMIKECAMNRIFLL